MTPAVKFFVALFFAFNPVTSEITRLNTSDNGLPSVRLHASHLTRNKQCNGKIPECEEVWVKCINTKEVSRSANCLPPNCFSLWQAKCSSRGHASKNSIKSLTKIQNADAKFSSSKGPGIDEPEEPEPEIPEEGGGGLSVLAIMAIVIAIHIPFVLFIYIAVKFRDTHFRHVIYRNPLLIKLCICRKNNPIDVFE